MLRSHSSSGSFTQTGGDDTKPYSQDVNVRHRAKEVPLTV